jgi:hypothetical protein
VSTLFEAGPQEALIDGILDEVARGGGFCMFHAHTWRSGFTEDRLESLIVRCLERGLRITTRDAALSL